MTDLDRLWLATLQEVVGRAAHEVKDALNGVSLNLEVIRSRSSRPGRAGGGEGGGDQSSLSAFAIAAGEQLEVLSARIEAILFLARVPRSANDPADVATVLKHLATLVVPATKADGGSLAVDGYQASAPTAASAQATRLALAAGLLALTKEGGSSLCRLQTGAEAVVRFSHESAIACSLDPAVAKAIAGHKIRSERSGTDLILVFPAS